MIAAQVAPTRLALEGLWQAFEAADGSEVVALRDVSLEVSPGEFVSIIGPSGCGKSTLLRVIAGLQRPTRGRASIGGRPVSDRLDELGVVFQKPTLLHWLSVEDNVLLPVRIRESRIGAPQRARARELLAMVGLERFAAMLPHELSGGMQQRVAICRALVRDPEILLMDEPFGALDALTREAMCFELLRIWSERRRTILFITHSIDEAVLLSDRVVVMTERPGAIAAVELVSVPRPRALESMTLAEFHASTQAIRNVIYGNSARRAASAPTL